jgi:WD40 repeat protein
VRLFRVSDGAQVGSLGTSAGEAVDVAFSPDGSLLAVAHRDESLGARVKIWRVADGSLLGELPSHSGHRPLAFCPHAMLLAVAGDCLSGADPPGVQLWRVPDLKLVRTIAQPHERSSGYVSAIAFSSDGNFMAVGDEAGTIQMCRVKDGEVVATVDTRHVFLGALTFSPDGSLLAHAGTSGPQIALCTPSTGSELLSLAGEQRTRGELGMPPAVTDLQFSRDGGLLAASESTGDLARVEVFDIKTGSLIRTLDAGMATNETLNGQPRRVADVRAVRFSPDGDHLAWCGSNGVIVSRAAELVG